MNSNTPRTIAIRATVLLTIAIFSRIAVADEARDAWSKGNEACVRGDFDSAIKYFTDGIRLGPNDPATYNNRGYAYLRRGDIEKAIIDYNDALRLDPKCAPALFFRGAAYEKKGDQDGAVADYTKAIRLDPRYARAYCDADIKAAKAPQPEKAPGHATPISSRTAVNYFVAPGGSDRNPGTIERPFATLYKAHEAVRPGDTVNLRAGAYEAMISWTKSGTPAAPITIRAYNGEDVRLQSSEQYSWTPVTNEVFGSCWNASIPERPIRYQGAQHSIWQDAVGAETDPRVHIWAIVKGGYMCAPMNDAADFAHPERAKGLPLTDGKGQLLHDITWYDRNLKTLWFKSGPSHVTDPSRQLFVTSIRSGQFSVAGSYLKIDGLKFEYLCDFHQQDAPTACDISNCSIKHASQGLVGGGERCTYSSLFVDKVGDWLTWRNAEYEHTCLSHCFYFNGTRCVISNCFFGRSNKGCSIHNYPDGLSENLFDSNVLYSSYGGCIFMGTSKNYITNNISLQQSWGLNPYVSAQGFHINHNYVEASDPFGFNVQDAGPRGTFERFTVEGNLFNAHGGTFGYIGNIVDATQSRIDRNVYLGKARWIVGFTQAATPPAARQEYTDFAAYAAGLQSLPGCAAWEKNSHAHATAPQFDFAAFDNYLDSDPPLAAALLRARQYARGVAAPYAGAGPAIDEPLSENRK